MCLGQAAGLLADSGAALEHYTAVRDALEDTRRPASLTRSVLLSMCLSGRSSALLQVGRVDEAADDGRRAQALAGEVGIAGLEAIALACLSGVAWHGGDRDGALQAAHQAQHVTDDMPGGLRRTLGQIVTAVLTDAGDLAAAEQACTAALASCREVGDVANLSAQLWNMTILDLRTERIDDATTHLRELLQIAMQTGLHPVLLAGLDCCGHLCSATRRPAEAVTVWAAMSTLAAGSWPLLLQGSRNLGGREELLRKARQLLGPTSMRAAEERGAAMSLATAAEYGLLLATVEPKPLAAKAATAGGQEADGAGAPLPGLDKLSPRERELVTLVAQGRTDAQIAASSTSACARSAPTWTGSGTRPAAGAAPTSPASPSPSAWSDAPRQRGVGDSTPSPDRTVSEAIRPLSRAGRRERTYGRGRETGRLLAGGTRQ